jgi:hypothetical protein
VPGGTANWSFAGNGNYNAQSGSVAVTINKANATINVTGYSATYDGAAHTAAGSATGVNGESLAGLDLTGTTHTNAGSYSDAWAFTDVTGNYNNATGSVSDSIAKAEANVAVNGYTGTYDGNAHGATGSATGVNSEDLIGLLNLGASFTNVPGGTANWTFAGNGNYNPQSGSVAITINKANATINVTGYSVTYDGAATYRNGFGNRRQRRISRRHGFERNVAHDGWQLQRFLDVHGRHGQLQQRERFRQRFDREGGSQRGRERLHGYL